MTPFSVFTGDLIQSSAAPPSAVEASLANIAGTAALLGSRLGQDLRFTRFRGDGWQIALAGRNHWYQALILILARLKATPGLLETRIAIAVGSVETLGSRDLNDARGFAFQASGKGLDQAQKRGQTEVRLASRLEPLTDGTGRRVEWATWADRALVAFIARTARDWSQAQAEALALALEFPDLTQAEWAARLGISRQAFVQRLAGAAYEELSLAILAGEQQGEPRIA